MDIKKIKILLLEDDHDDAWLIFRVLKKQNFEFELTIVSTKAKYLKELTEAPPDIILCDHYLPMFTSTEALAMLEDLGLNIPFILVTGTMSEEFAITTMKNGVSDYILKDRLQRLPAAITSALQKSKSEILQSEAQLKIDENEKKYASLIQHLPANIALLDREGTIVDVNNQWKLFAEENGHTSDNYGIGSNYIEIAKRKHEADNADGILIAEAIEKIIEGEQNNFSVIYPCHSPSKKRWFKAIVSRENDGSDSGIVIMHVDVTEQQEAEVQVKQSQANLLSIFNNTDIGLILLDSDLNVVSCNKIANLWATAVWDINLLEGVNLISMLTVDKQRLTQNLMKRVLTGVPFDNEDSYTMSDGSIHWFRMKINDVKDNNDLPIGLCISATDITDQVLARKKLEESERRFQSLIERSTDMKTLVTQEGKMTYASPAVTKALGYSIDEFLNTPVHDLICNEDLPDVLEKIQEVMICEGKSIYSQHRLIHKNGQMIWCEGTITNMFHEPNIQALVSNFRNITERKNAELERERIGIDLLKHMVNLEQFAYIVSHNLRGPVASILGMVNILQYKISDADRTKGLKHLLDATVQMDDTIKDLNKILQLKSEYSDFKETINLPDLLTEIESNIQNAIIKEQVKIEANFGNINSITTIKSYMHSIFYNLILNSIKYRKKEVNPIIEIRSDLYDGRLRLVFKDNGKGIDLNLYGSRLFGLYNRFHLDVEGKGLGLFMIKTQIEVLGGSITVKSEPGKGAEFTVELPL